MTSREDVTNETATGVIALWLAQRWGHRTVPDACRNDARELVERLRSSRIGFRLHEGEIG